ncbi:MAG TPA: response regulator [Chloroflexota bacterium]|nr:response regulator [Chloroflexota bacterium]
MQAGAAAGRRERVVLVVDDDQDVRELLLAVLALLGLDAAGPVRVLTAPDAGAALTLAGERTPDLVLLDVAPAGADGFELCRRLRADPRLRAVPLVALAAFGGPDAPARARAAGCDGYIAKPFDLDELLAAVRRWLDGAARAAP